MQLRARLAVITALLAQPAAAAAFSQGSPICEVAQLPLVEMSPTLASPPPAGWRLEIARPVFMTGRPVRVRVVNAEVGRRALGVLAWARDATLQGAGSWQFDPERFQTVPPPAGCGDWAITHRDAQSKPQDQLVFRWLPAAESEVILRAFLIEDCGMPGACRAHQALTPVVALRPALFFDSFEDD